MSAITKSLVNMANAPLAAKDKAEKMLADHKATDPATIRKLAEREAKTGHPGIAAWMYAAAGSKQDYDSATPLFEKILAFPAAFEMRMKAGMKQQGAAMLESKLCEKAGQFELAAVMLMKAGVAEDVAWAKEARLRAHLGDIEGSDKMSGHTYRSEWVAKFF